MFLLESWSRSVNVTSLENLQRLAEYSQSTKLLVSFKLKSDVRWRPSPTLPPRPNFRPALSFFFLAVRTFWKWTSMFVGNCKAGRCQDRASCFCRRVLYCTNQCSGGVNGRSEGHLRMAVAASERDTRARPRVAQRFDGHDVCHLPWPPRRSDHWID